MHASTLQNVDIDIYYRANGSITDRLYRAGALTDPAYYEFQLQERHLTGKETYYIVAVPRSQHTSSLKLTLGVSKYPYWLAILLIAIMLLLISGVIFLGCGLVYKIIICFGEAEEMKGLQEEDVERERQLSAIKKAQFADIISDSKIYQNHVLDLSNKNSFIEVSGMTGTPAPIPPRGRGSD